MMVFLVGWLMVRVLDGRTRVFSNLPDPPQRATAIALPNTYDEEIAEAIYRSLPAYASMLATLSRSLGKREKQRAAEKPRLFEK
jgi:hypothetical protein